MKKIIGSFALVLVVVLVYVLAGCAVGTGDKMLVKIGLDAVIKTKNTSLNDNFISMNKRIINLVDPDNSLEDFQNVIQEEDMSSPKAVYELKFDEKELIDGNYNQTEEYDELPENLKNRVLSNSLINLSTMYNSENKSNSYSAVLSLFSESGSASFKSLDKPRALVYVFDTGYSVLVVFTPESDNIVSYDTRWLTTDCEKIYSEESLISELHLQTVQNLVVTKLD